MNFNQPNAQSVTLNRVIGNERSVIDGAMNANGKVFISNANGMLIGKDAKINVGSLVATTANISDDDVMNGRYQFTGEGTGSIENLGQISVPKGGVVALVAPIVKNGGTITAPQANVLLASAESFSITLPDNANFSYTLDKGTLQGLVDNGGAILADGGRVVLTAQGVDTVKKSLIKHTGAIQANTAQNKNGVIELLGDLDNSVLNVSGSLKAEAKESGDGGFIETSASQVKIEDSAEVSTLAENGKTGTWLIDPNDIIIASGAGVKPDGTPYKKDEVTATGKKVGELLAKNSIGIESTKGKSTGGKGDIIIDDEISWSNNNLHLIAQNDIHINKTLNGTKKAKLILMYGQATDMGENSNYYLQKNKDVNFRTAKINLPAGTSLSIQKGKKGEHLFFTVIHQLPKAVNERNRQLAKFTSNNIALGKDIDARETKKYDNFAGYEFLTGSGNFHGLGHQINNLTINNNRGYINVGFITEANSIRDIKLSNANVSSTRGYDNIGVIAGNANNIDNVSVLTSWLTVNDPLSNTGNVGGVAGNAVNVYNSFSNAIIRSNGKEGKLTNVGGLVGDADNIHNSHAKGNLFVNSSSMRAGGLVGVARGLVTNSSATGHVTAKDYGKHNLDNDLDDIVVGGLVGNVLNSGQIVMSYATGNVSATGLENYAGGLVGLLGSWEGKSTVWAKGNISNSYATGKIYTKGDLAISGGLVGSAAPDSKITNSYFNSGSIQATGKHTQFAGGLVGYNAMTTPIVNSYYNQSNSPNIKTFGYIGSGVKEQNLGRTNAQLKQKTTFQGWDFDKIWRIEQGKTSPYFSGAKIAVENIDELPYKSNIPNKKTDVVEIIDHTDTYYLLRYSEQTFAGMPLSSNGFLIKQPIEYHYSNGSVKYDFPIFNKMNAALEVQVYDANGNLVDSKIVDPNYHQTSVTGYGMHTMGAMSDSVKGEGLSGRAHTRKTDISITVPKGGTVKFTYNSTKAKTHNFVEPLTEFYSKILEGFFSSVEFKKIMPFLVEFSTKELLNELSKQSMQGSLKGSINQDSFLTIAQNVISNTLSQLQNPEIMAKLLDASFNNMIDPSSLEKSRFNRVNNQIAKLTSKVQGISLFKEGAEHMANGLNLYAAYQNVEKDLSSYDVILDTNKKRVTNQSGVGSSYIPASLPASNKYIRQYRAETDKYEWINEADRDYFRNANDE